MDSLVQRRITDYLTEADDHYFKGKYDKCVHTFQLLREELNATKSLLEVCSMDRCVFSCLIENNILTSKSLAFKWYLHDYGTWNGLMQDFLRLHQQMKSLQTVDSAPLKCYLNVVYNALYWGWQRPNGLHCDKSHIETCMQMAVSCFKRVLEVCNDPCQSLSFCDTEDMILCLMKRISNNLLQVGGEESLQLLEIHVIIIYMLTELRVKKEIITECTSIIASILSVRSNLVSSVHLAVKNKKKEAVSNFKFGFYEVDSAVGRCDIETVLEILKAAYCMCFIQTGQYAKCVACLEVCEDTDVKFQAIKSYIKAYACYHCNDTEACLLSLAELENMPVSTQMKVRGHLLCGSLLAKQGRHFEALQEFFKPLSIGLQDTQEKKDFYPVTLYHIAEEYEALRCLYEANHTDAKTMQDHGKCGARRTELLHASLRADHLDTLRHLVQVLKDDDDESAVHTNSSFSFQLKILNILHPQPEINLPIALFKLATILATDGNSREAGKLFMEILAQRELQPVPSLITQLPHASVIHHTAAVLLLKSKDLEQAELLCRQAISYHSSKSYSPRDMEHFLLCLEDDLVASMLLAQVHKLKGEEIKESEILDRCLRLVHNFKRNEASVKYMTLHEETEGVEACKTKITQLLNGLESKLHLQKAQNYLRRGSSFQNDSFFEFKQALLCNSGDKDVVFSYKLFLDENHQYHGHDKSLPLNRCLELHVKNYNSLVLNHLLQSQTSEDSDVDLFLEL